MDSLRQKSYSSKRNSNQMKNKKATPVFSCHNGVMYNVVDGVMIPKKVNKLFPNQKIKTKNNEKYNRKSI
jgi:hypothetical protein